MHKLKSRRIHATFYHFYKWLKELCGRLEIVYYFKILFGSNLKRKNISKGEDLNAKELTAIQKTWAGIHFKDYWFKWYKWVYEHSHRDSSLNAEFMSRFIPDNLYFYYFCPRLSDVNVCQSFDDKNMYDLYFPGVQMPTTLFRKIDGKLLDKEYLPILDENTLAFLDRQTAIVIKPSIDSSGGKGVLFMDGTCDKKEIMECLKRMNNCIVQERICQHKVLSDIHPSSINTIRIVSFYYQGKVEILSAILRIGIGDSKVDNSSSGGIFIGISQDGLLKEYAFNKWGSYYQKHPTSGFVFKDTLVPGFNKCKQLCIDQHYRLIQFTHLVSWDLAIGIDGNPILIEANLTFGDIDFHQIANGPLFGSFTDSVIQMVFSDKINRAINKVFF